MKYIRLIIFDLDNTIYDWYAAFLPAFYGMVDVAVDALNCSRETLLDELQRVHIKHQDVEHPFSLAETDIVQNLMQIEGEKRVWRLLDPAFHAFNSLRKANLKVFPGTVEALDAMAGCGVRLVAYTDSKYFAAWGRIRRLGLTDKFDKIYCREKGDSILPSGLDVYDVPPDGKIVQIPSHETKPNPRVLTDIVEMQKFSMPEAAYVGDSLAKDVLMAKRSNCFAVWAKYGSYTDPLMYERLVRVSHWSKADIHLEKHYALEAGSIKPDFICEHSLGELAEKIFALNS